MHMKAHTALFIVAKTWKKPRFYVILLSSKKKWAIKLQRAWINLKYILLTRRSQCSKTA